MLIYVNFIRNLSILTLMLLAVLSLNFISISLTLIEFDKIQMNESSTMLWQSWILIILYIVSLMVLLRYMRNSIAKLFPDSINFQIIGLIFLVIIIVLTWSLIIYKEFSTIKILTYKYMTR